MIKLLHVIPGKGIGNVKKTTSKQPRWMVTAVEFNCMKGH